MDVVCVEPNIEAHPYFSIVSLDYALKYADVIVVLVGHKEFKVEVNLQLLRRAKALDFCGIIS